MYLGDAGLRRRYGVITGPCTAGDRPAARLATVNGLNNDKGG